MTMHHKTSFKNQTLKAPFVQKLSIYHFLVLKIFII